MDPVIVRQTRFLLSDDFLDIPNSELSKLYVCDILNESLLAHEIKLKNRGIDIQIDALQSFEPPEHKKYLAKGTTTTTINEEKYNLTVVLFEPGDGTGSTDYYDFNIDPRWTPRDKFGEAEVMFGLGTRFGEYWFPGMTTLESKGIAYEKSIKTLQKFFSEQVLFSYLVTDREMPVSRSPQVGLTYHDVEPHPIHKHHMHEAGNPHAIVFDERNVPPLVPFSSVFSAAAFLEFSTKGDPGYHEVVSAARSGYRIT